MKLPRLQFSLRALLIAVTLAALPLGWFSFRLRQAERQRETVTKLRNRNSGGEYHVSYDWETPPDGSPVQAPQAPKATWLRKTLGNDFFDRVVAVETYIAAPDPDTPRLVAGLPDLEILDLAGNTAIDDRSAGALVGLGRLRRLNLSDTKIGDDGLACLAGMAELEDLDLAGTRVTDEGLVHLAPLAKLKTLRLAETKISGEHLDRLNALGCLESLDLSYTSVRADDLAKLRLPKLQALRISLIDRNQPAAEAVSPRSFDGLPNLQKLYARQAAARPGWMAAILRLSKLTELYLQDDDVADGDLEQIDQLGHLHYLDLRRTKVDDAGLVSLARLPELERVWLDAPKETGPLTPRGFAAVQVAQLPKLQIYYGPDEGFNEFHQSADAAPAP